MCGFPHSEIPGSKLICSSPRLIAACHVLHRLLMPRHSPYALCSLNFLVLFEFYLCLKIAISFLFGCLVEKTLVYHPSAKLYFLPLLFGKTKLNLYCFLSICSFSIPFSKIKRKQPHFFGYLLGRSGWTRTIDLALIRRAL